MIFYQNNLDISRHVKYLVAKFINCNNIIIKALLLIILICSVNNQLFSQKRFTISGYITDKSSGESLIGAMVSDTKNKSQGSVSNDYGFYSISMLGGKHEINFSYLGYKNYSLDISLNKDTLINIPMISGIVLEDIVIDAERQNSRKNIETSQLGIFKLDAGKIKELPALMGEADVLKSLQLLPGVKATGDGSSGFYVRGGGSDQNLILLDEATVYNTGHMLGFFSVFNADAVKNATLIKGGIPANYGHRLSSVVDIKMKEGNDKNFTVNGGIGLISSRLSLEGPVLKEKCSFILSGRRTYILDLAQPFLKGGKFEGTNYYFYDFNAKVNYKISDKDRLYLSGYYGQDIFSLNFKTRNFMFEMPYGNSISTLRWNHVINSKLFLNLSTIYNSYEYRFTGSQEKFTFQNHSGIKDYNLKADMDYFFNSHHYIKTGYNFTYHYLTPNILSAAGEDFTFGNDGKSYFGYENNIYLLDEIKVTTPFLVNVGLRANYFSQMGYYVSKITGDTFANNQNVKNYFTLDPRFSFRYKLSENNSIKGGVSFTSQFLHQVSNSAGSLPNDIWVMSTEYVKPEFGVQYSAGFFKNFKKDQYESSVEIYYKDLKNQIEFREDYFGSFDQDLENKFVFGKGQAYGIEFFVKKNSGKLNGWISYTYSITRRKFDKIDNGNWFRTTYDKPHDLSVVVNYQLAKNWSLSGVFAYSSGKRYTPVSDFYVLDGQINLEYGPRNTASYSDYHRMDLTLEYKKPSSKKWQSSWSFGVYNLYNRKNPSFVNYETIKDNDNGSVKISASKITIFPLIPSITYNFSWNSKKQ